MSVQNKVLVKLKSQYWVSAPEFEALFPPGEEGHYSWSQRLRGLREQGYIIICRKRVNCKHTFEWHLERQPEVLIEKNNQFCFI